MRVVCYISNLGILEESEVNFHLLILFRLLFPSEGRILSSELLDWSKLGVERCVSTQALVWEAWPFGRVDFLA